jgi:hypothetical protein
MEETHSKIVPSIRYQFRGRVQQISTTKFSLAIERILDDRNKARQYGWITCRKVPQFYGRLFSALKWYCRMMIAVPSLRSEANFHPSQRQPMPDNLG